MKKTISLLLTLVLCLPFLCTTAAAKENGPTKAEIRTKYQTVTQSTTIFDTLPSITAPYATGKLTDEFLKSGITYLNFVRFVAGLPEVTLDNSLNTDAQHGAVCLAAIDELTHYPSQPVDMDDTFFNRAYGATTSANISCRWGYDPLYSLQSAVSGCMDDNSSLNNLSCVGHRRWLLNPTLGKVGFGYARSAENWDYIVNHVFDRSGPGCDYDFISWPVAGNHPTILFNTKNPWSITLNPNIYKKPSADSVKITVTRVSDGKTWNFDSTTGAPESAAKAYMTVNNQGYGVSNCIIFHPGSANVDNYEGIFTVDVTGIYTKSGQAAELHYQVDFFDINRLTLFDDVVPGSFYEPSVAWAVENGITNGLSSTKFGPNENCNRAQVVTFLWRAAGSPAPTTTVNPFTDVEQGSFYEKAVLWAVENNITNGLSSTKFGPNETCNRAQVVTFLWRSRNCPNAQSGTDFTDIQPGSFYEKAVLWAVENGITNGISSSAFGVNANCNRAQIVTFLYRTFVN